VEHDAPMRFPAGMLALACALGAGSCSEMRLCPDSRPQVPRVELADWQRTLAERVSTFGRRNLIAVVDAAFPESSSPGVETVVTGRRGLEVLGAVIDSVRGSPHLRAHVFLDRELDLVPEEDAAGIGAYREALRKVLGDAPVEPIPYDDLVARLDKVAGAFRVLVLKTETTLPYSSVFVQLESGSWSDAAEKRLREALEAKKP